MKVLPSLPCFCFEVFKHNIKLKTHNLTHLPDVLALCFRSCSFSRKLNVLGFTYASQNPPGFLEFLLRMSDIPAIIFRHHSSGWQRTDTYHVQNNWPLGICPVLSSRLLFFSWNYPMIGFDLFVWLYFFSQKSNFQDKERIKMVTGSHPHFMLLFWPWIWTDIQHFCIGKGNMDILTWWICMHAVMPCMCAHVCVHYLYHCGGNICDALQKSSKESPHAMHLDI